MRARIGRFLGRRDTRCAAGILVAFVFLFGYLFIRTFVSAPTPHFELEFASARWLEPATAAPVVYFRKDIYLPAAVDQAWMQIGATDSFELYVNGAIVATNEFDATNTSGVFDLKTLLHSGHNAIGVLVTRTIYPEPARLIARLSTRSAGSPARDVFTDETWRAAPNTALVPPGIHWSSPEFDASQWAGAKPAVRFDPHVNQVDLDPRALATAPQGDWLSAPNAAAREQGFIANFHIADPTTRSLAANRGDRRLRVDCQRRVARAANAPDAGGESVAVPEDRSVGRGAGDERVGQQSDNRQGSGRCASDIGDNKSGHRSRRGHGPATGTHAAVQPARGWTAGGRRPIASVFGIDASAVLHHAVAATR